MCIRDRFLWCSKRCKAQFLLILMYFWALIMKMCIRDRYIAPLALRWKDGLSKLFEMGKVVPSGNERAVVAVTLVSTVSCRIGRKWVLIDVSRSSSSFFASNVFCVATGSTAICLLFTPVPVFFGITSVKLLSSLLWFNVDRLEP